jgi:uncharacterized protein (TIGR02391 family)
MATQKSKRPLRPWNITSLLVLGQREGVKANYLKAIPVIILEKWVRHGRIEDQVNFISTDELAERLEESGLRQNSKGKSNGVLLGSLSTIQNSRNLKDPPLIEYRGFKGDAMFWVNLPHYEPLLQEYRKKYRELLPEDYKKLFPIPKEEPDWESPSLSSVGQVSGEAEPTHPESEVQDEIPSLLAQVEQAWRDRQQAIEKLTKENQELQAKLVALQAAVQEGREVPHRSIVDEELRNDCAKLLENKEYYIDAIRRASVVLEVRLNKAAESTGAEGLYGASLVRYLLAKDTGKLIISSIPNEQDGVHQLFSGAFAFVRNPPAHKKVQYTELEVWQTISLIDYLLLLLRQAKSR